MRKIIAFLIILAFCFNLSLAEDTVPSGSAVNYKGVDERDNLDMFKVAIIPFSVSSAKLDKKINIGSFQDGLNEAIIAQFTQSRKFRVASRNGEDLDTYDKEVNRILDSDSAEERAKLNRRIGADYILTGDILSLSIQKKKTSYYGEDFTTWNVSATVAYRMIEFATMEVKWSNVVTVNIPTNIANQYLNSNSSDYSQAISYLEQKIGNIIGDQIIGAIFPLQVLKVDDGEVYFNQGGNRVLKGSVYEVRQSGGTTIDEATGQHIVLDSKVLAKVRITDVMPKYSIGIVIDGSLSKIKKGSRAYFTKK